MTAPEPPNYQHPTHGGAYPPPGDYSPPSGWAPPTGQPQQPAPAQRKGLPRWVLPVGVGVVALLIGAGIGNAGGSSEPAAAAKPPATVTATATLTSVSTVTATPPPPTATVTTTFTPVPAVAFTDGTFVVGTDIQPGRYRTTGGGGDCYWARLGSLDTSDILDNNIVTGPATIEVQAGDTALETSGGCSWSHVN